MCWSRKSKVLFTLRMFSREQTYLTCHQEKNLYILLCTFYGLQQYFWLYILMSLS